MNGFNSIAIDGPAERERAALRADFQRNWGYIYVDTGAIYRASAYGGTPPRARYEKMRSLSRRLPEISIEMRYNDEGEQRMFLDGEDVSAEIRMPRYPSAPQTSRRCLRCAHTCWRCSRRMARTHNVVMDGRDIGTVVLPDAELKIFLTASAAARAAPPA